MGKTLPALAVSLLLLCTSCYKDQYGLPTKKVIAPNDLVETGPDTLMGITTKVNDIINGYYVGLPAHYKQTTKAYPTIFFLHGAGQYGNGSVDLADVLNEGIPNLLDSRTFPPNFIVNGKNYSFIILAPQFEGPPSDEQIASFIEFAQKNYRLDSSRLYLAGFSLGGRLTAEFATVYTSKLAAVIPMAGSLTYDYDSRGKVIADGKLPVWSFHNDSDQLISSEESKDFTSGINSHNPAIPAKLTLFPPFGILNHDCWTKATDPNFRENGMNIYEWMLQYKR